MGVKFKRKMGEKDMVWRLAGFFIIFWPKDVMCFEPVKDAPLLAQEKSNAL